MDSELKPCSCGREHITVGPGPVNSIVVACNGRDCYVMVRGNDEEQAVRIWQHMRRQNDDG